MCSLDSTPQRSRMPMPHTTSQFTTRLQVGIVTEDRGHASTLQNWEKKKNKEHSKNPFCFGGYPYLSQGQTQQLWGTLKDSTPGRGLKANTPKSHSGGNGIVDSFSSAYRPKGVRPYASV